VKHCKNKAATLLENVFNVNCNHDFPVECCSHLDLTGTSSAIALSSYLWGAASIACISSSKHSRQTPHTRTCCAGNCCLQYLHHQTCAYNKRLNHLPARSLFPPPLWLWLLFRQFRSAFPCSPLPQLCGYSASGPLRRHPSPYHLLHLSISPAQAQTSETPQQPQTRASLVVMIRKPPRPRRQAPPTPTAGSAWPRCCS
jgi:hypothetical protein